MLRDKNPLGHQTSFEKQRGLRVGESPGRKVRGIGDKKLGDLRDVVVFVSTGKVAFLVVSTSGGL